jgi:putative FmdB family regulatory protein
MPTYDYVCDACDHEFELFQSITAEAEKKCPECGKKRLRRLIGPGAAIIFKGSGFYCTDYRSGSYKKAADADKSGSSSSASSGSESKKSDAPKSDTPKAETSKSDSSKSKSKSPK